MASPAALFLSLKESREVMDIDQLGEYCLSKTGAEDGCPFANNIGI